MRRHLAGEDCVFLPHPVLDEGVADAVDERGASGSGDRPRHGPACANVVEDRAARVFGQDDLGEQRGHEVARDEGSGVVDEEATICVPVVRHSQVGAGLARLRDDELAILG